MIQNGMSTYKKQKPQVTLMAVARLLPRSPKNRAIAFEVLQQYQWSQGEDSPAG